MRITRPPSGSWVRARDFGQNSLIARCVVSPRRSAHRWCPLALLRKGEDRVRVSSTAAPLAPCSHSGLYVCPRRGFYGERPGGGLDLPDRSSHLVAHAGEFVDSQILGGLMGQGRGLRNLPHPTLSLKKGEGALSQRLGPVQEKPCFQKRGKGDEKRPHGSGDQL